MTGHSPRSLGLALAIASLVTSLPALSQVRVNVTTAASPPATCVMTTDANGLSLVPGTTDLKATGVTFSPAGCGQGTGGLPPPTPPNFPLSGVPASGTAPLSFTVAWDLVNAVTCTGSATKDGATTTIAGWTDSNAASPESRSLTLTQAGTYALTLTCGNGASPPATITSRVATVAVSGGGGGDDGTCHGPTGLTRLTQSNITYGPVNLSARPNVDVKEWNNIWGHATTGDAVTPWPGVNGAGPVIRQFGRTTFLAAHFNTGSHGEPNYGVLAYASNIGGPNVDIRISQTCGDFSAGCSRTSSGEAKRPRSSEYTRRVTTVAGAKLCSMAENTMS